MIKENNKKIKVAVAEFPPLVEKKGRKYSGFEIELWEKIAKEKNIKYSYLYVPFKKIFSTVKSGKAKIGFAGASINLEREKVIDFSYPTFDSGLSILVPLTQKVSIWSTLKIIFNQSIKKILLILLGFIFLIGHLIWFIEKGAAFSSSYFPGIIEALWWGVVTVSTVGYGDFSPVTMAGRIVGMFVILLGLAIFGLYIAKISSIMTIKSLQHEIGHPKDLKGKKVATKSNTTSEDILRELGADVVTFSTTTKVFKHLEKFKVDAVVLDSPVVMNYLNNGGKKKAKITGNIFKKQKYGFVIKEGDPFREKINRSILKLNKSGFYKKLYIKYFGQN